MNEILDSIMRFASHPVTQEIWGGIKYTAPRVARVVREQMMAKTVSSADVEAAAADTAAPIFDDMQQGEHDENRTGVDGQAQRQP